MARAEIISEVGAGEYRITRKWGGRSNVEAEISQLNTEISALQVILDNLPPIPTTEEEITERQVTQLKIVSRQKRVEYLTNKFPADETINAWCADFSEELTGEVGTIDIPGEWTNNVNIRPNVIDSNAYDITRDGEFYPPMATGPFTTLLAKMTIPYWQKFKPLHRYGIIADDSIDHAANTCSVMIDAAFSSQQIININQGDEFGTEVIAPSGEKSLTFFVQNAGSAHPGFLDFVDRHPSHPISNVTELAPPIQMSDEQYIQLKRICRKIDYFFRYQGDQSGYVIGDSWDLMYDLGDPWYWTPTYSGEPQGEFAFGDITLEYDDSGLVIGLPNESLEEYFLWGSYLQQNIELEFASNQLPIIGPRPRTTGDCEDYVLTKMQAIIEAGIIPAENLQILLCYVVNGGYHAVLGIQTSNRGFLISDQRDYGQLWEINQLSRTHMWDAFSVATAAGGSAVKWAKTQVLKIDVPIEYMNCNSAAFEDGDHVIVEFTGQDWDNPKVIGFVEEPQDCHVDAIFTFGINPRSYDVNFCMKYDVTAETWEAAGPTGPFSALRKTRSKVTKNNPIYYITGGATRGDDYLYQEPWPSGCVIDLDENCEGASFWTYSYTQFTVRYDASIFNALAESWTIAPDYPAPRRAKHSGWYIGNKHYLVGGTNYPNGWVYEEGLGSQYSDHQDHDVHDDCDSFDEITETYEAKTSMPTGLQRMADFAIGNIGYTAGGSQVTYSFDAIPCGWALGVSWGRKYDTINDTWDTITSMPQWRYDCAGFAIGGYGYVARGHEGVVGEEPGGDFTLYCGEVIDFHPSDKPMQYNPGGDSWAYVQNHSVRAYNQFIRGHSSAEEGGFGYSVSINLNGNGLLPEKYDPVADTWELGTTNYQNDRVSDQTAA